MAARIAHVVLVRRRQRRPAVGEDDARVVDHLEVEHDDARRLPDPEPAVVAIRHHRRGHAARDAAVPAVEVRGRVEGRRLAGQRPAAAHLERAALSFRRQSRQQAVRWIDDERGLPLRRARVGHAREERPAVLALLDQLPTEISATGGGGDPLLELLFRPPRLVHVAGRPAEAGGVGAPFQRDAGGLHHVQVGLDVGFTPPRLRVDPAFRGSDEVVGLAWRSENRLAMRGHDENRTRRGTEQCNAHRLHDSHSLRHTVLGVRCASSCAD